MKKINKIILIFFLILQTNTIAKENIMILKLKDGDVKIELFKDVAPNHVERIKKLADDGNYDGVVFHRVIDGFMAQTGDVKFGNTNNNDFDLNRAGMGGSDLPDLKSEFNNLPHDRGTLSMARSSDPRMPCTTTVSCVSVSSFASCACAANGRADSSDTADALHSSVPHFTFRAESARTLSVETVITILPETGHSQRWCPSSMLVLVRRTAPAIRPARTAIHHQMFALSSLS